jgi:hypothetical protein
VTDRVSFLATNEKGVLRADDQWLYVALMASLPARVRVTVERERQIRSLKANARYWSCIVPMVAAVLSVSRDVPLSNDQAHHVLKAAFIGTEDTPLGPVPKSSAGLDTAAFSAYCERIEGHFASEFGASIPNSESA